MRDTNLAELFGDIFVGPNETMPNVVLVDGRICPTEDYIVSLLLDQIPPELASEIRLGGPRGNIDLPPTDLVATTITHEGAYGFTEVTRWALARCAGPVEVTVGNPFPYLPRARVVAWFGYVPGSSQPTFNPSASLDWFFFLDVMLSTIHVPYFAPHLFEKGLSFR